MCNSVQRPVLFTWNLAEQNIYEETVLAVLIFSTDTNFIIVSSILLFSLLLTAINSLGS
jgi:hypothetical protein